MVYNGAVSVERVEAIPRSVVDLKGYSPLPRSFRPHTSVYVASGPFAQASTFVKF